MREQRRFSVRFALTNPQHAKAWELLSLQCEGQKNDFVIAAIAGNTDMRQVVREEIRAALLDVGPLPPRATVREEESPQEIPSDILDFLQSL